MIGTLIFSFIRELIGGLIYFIHLIVDSFHFLEDWVLSFIRRLIPFIHYRVKIPFWTFDKKIWRLHSRNWLFGDCLIRHRVSKNCILRHGIISDCIFNKFSFGNCIFARAFLGIIFFRTVSLHFIVVCDNWCTGRDDVKIKEKWAELCPSKEMLVAFLTTLERFKAWSFGSIHSLEAWFLSFIGLILFIYWKIDFFFYQRVDSCHSLEAWFLSFVWRLIPFICRRVASFHRLESWFLSFIGSLIPIIH